LADLDAKKVGAKRKLEQAEDALKSVEEKDWNQLVQDGSVSVPSCCAVRRNPCDKK
jgi:transcriptional regulator of nitric oxide reductase